MKKDQVRFKNWGGQVIGGTIHKRFLCFAQIEYTKAFSWADPDPYVSTQRVKWFPVWRIL